MPKKLKPKTYEEALAWFRENGFDVLEAPATSGRVFLKKYNASAAIERAADGGVKIFAYPGYLVGGEIAKLVDKGNQKLLQTTKTQIAATADHLRALHQFAEELKEGTGGISLYNESLGTVSAEYKYDRLPQRDLPEGERAKRPWEKKPA
jgi:hypothetical protein